MSVLGIGLPTYIEMGDKSMAPRMRNSMVCVSCGEGMLWIGKGEEEVLEELKCQACWQLFVDAQKERINELEASIESREEEQDSFKECCDCGEFRAKVGELEKKLQEMGKGSG